MPSSPDKIPTEMRAWRWSGCGTPTQVLKLETNVPVLPPKSKEVLLKVHATSLNPVDSKAMEDNIVNKLIKRPHTPGVDVVGTVVSVGSHASKFKIGDKVFGYLQMMMDGGLAEYCTSDETCLVKAPENLTDTELAGLPLVSVTAWQGLVQRGAIKQSMRVLILGGSGGVGTVSIQLAKHFGAYVICTCSGRNEELVRSLGADQVIDYTIADVADVLKDDLVDLVFDCVGGVEAYEEATRILKPSGSFITIVGDEHKIGGYTWLLRNGARLVSRKAWSFIGHPNYIMFSGSTDEAQLEEVRKLIAEGALKPVVDSVFSFDQSLEAFERQLSGRCRGKVIVELDQSQ
ncbi:GroES-like protein [Basidiobolus meristosporus CBS 931.73]|uniref:GroES-like protein n=1 Tax=Basidiobolus meristosporus CBS 931.73 TaxID=1314790 RepID=A0A1Y1Y2P1_9FUNG|nr:GroES-like protein [Basidiobolus meristosporus CBS 931.73]|eukprot:ORX92281.1 GroES-like protein [Basidiobolus meristosporus CBS 931.73]